MAMDLNIPRVKFDKGKQKIFISGIMKSLNYPSLRKLSKNLGISYSSLKRYNREESLIPYSLFEGLCIRANVDKRTFKIQILPANWGAKKGGQKGMRTLLNKYKKEMVVWRKKGGIQSGVLRSKSILIPHLNEDLAEFIGVYLGDGTMTKYFVRISADPRYEQPYFEYLSKLVYNTFGIQPSIYFEKNKNLFYLLICSHKLCNFLHTKFKINYGNKKINQTIIPKQILCKKRLLLACLRGLVDTDGCVTRRGNQFSVQFDSNNESLLKQVYEAGKNFGVFTYLTGASTGTNSKEKVLKYFNIVGSSNLKHIVRFEEWQKRGCVKLSNAGKH